MKKFFYSMLTLAAAFTFISCEDVPEPYDLPGIDEGNGTTIIEATGTGTADDPFNVAAAIAKCKEIGTTASTEVYYVKGVVNAINTSGVAQYGNVNIDMVDEGGSDVFKAFQILSFNGVKFTDDSASQINTGDVIVVKGNLVNYNDNTPETNGKGTAWLVSINGKGEDNGGGGNEITGDPTGTGTADDPYNVVAALKICEKLEKSSTSASYLSDEVYVKGKIVSIVDTELSSYGNITYYISDDGSAANQLEVYRGMSFNGAKFTALSDIKAGDEVVLVGKLQNWLGTYEFTQGAKLVSLNGSTGNGGGDNPTPDLGTPAGSGTEADPYNVAAAIGVAVEAGETATTEAYYVKGIVSKTASYPNTFFISDDGKNANEFEFYNGIGIDGATLVVGDVEVGDKVVIYGNIVNYMGNTPEMTKGCQLISIEKGAGNTGAGGGVEDDEKTIVFNAGVEKGSISYYNNAGADSMTKNGITISITKGCLGMSAHYRTYKNESMTVASSVGNIASIEFTCTAEGNAQYGPGCWTATDGSYTYEGVVGTWTGDAASVSFTASTAQVRATKIVVRLK